MKVVNSVDEALNYLKKQGIVFQEGSNEMKNLLYLFNKTKDTHTIVIPKITCKCGYIGDNGMFTAIRKDLEEFKKKQRLYMICQNCMGISIMLLKDYKMEKEAMADVLDLIWEVGIIICFIAFIFLIMWLLQ